MTLENLANHTALGMAILVGFALGCCVVVGLVLFDRSRKNSKDHAETTPAWDEKRIVFLFAAHNVIQMTQAAADFLENTIADRTPADTSRSDWSRIHDILQPRFPDLPDNPDHLLPFHHSILGTHCPKDPAQLVLETWDGHLRLSVIDPVRATMPTDERAWLRLAVTGAPYPIWQSDLSGQVIWCNAAYRALVDRFAPSQAEAAKAMAEGEDPLPPLFEMPVRPTDENRTFRVPLTPRGAQTPYWFDVHAQRLDGGWMNYATDVNAVVNAEIAQRNFVQTLTKTFAQLSIGLAIFDRKRQLALFNPALIDLTQLPAEFLSARPNLLSFFDRLRDRKMMPEPKNYRSWRDQISDLVAAADHGQYRETWSLPGGLTYRISGRPHPDGAVAFLFEDISAEVSSTRRFRSQLELGQSVLNTLEQSIAVFSASGMLTYSNSAYCAMWGVDADSQFIDISVNDASRHWQAGSMPTPVWGDLRDFVVQFGQRSDWQAEIRLKDGRPVTCRVVPMAGGTTLVIFELMEGFAQIAADYGVRSLG